VQARQRARQGDALLLPSRERSRLAGSKFRQPEGLEQLVGSFARRRVADVLRHREMRKQRVVLKQKTGATLLCRKMNAAPGVEPGNLAEDDRAGIGPFQTGEHPQQRSFPRARWAEKHRDRRVIERNPQFRLHFEAPRQALAALASQLIGHTAQMRRCSAYVSASTAKETPSRNSDVADAAP
jgi:hypothetical protein